MRQPENNVSRMIGQPIWHYRIVEKLGGAVWVWSTTVKEDESGSGGFHGKAAGPH
jgi:hypothetical protein